MIDRGGVARAWRGVVLVAVAAWAGNVAAETYVILSLVGDHLTVVRQRGQTGSHIDANESEVMPMAGSGFDDFAARTADATIARTRPDAGSVTIRATDASVYKIRDAWLDADVRGVAEMLADVKRQLPPLSDAHLLLITPYRDEPSLKTGSDARGSGKVSGLGFYLDFDTRFKDLTATRGYLGVYANFQMILINLRTDAVEAHERIVLGTTHPAAYAPDRTVWNALTSTQKARAIEALLKKGIESSLPRMLSSKKM